MKATCQQILSALRRPGARDDGGAADAAGRRPQDREPGADPRAPQRREHLRRHARAPDLEPARLGRDADARTRPSTRSTLSHRKRWWPVINLYLVTWGQNVCRPVYPLCGSCVLADLCPRIGVTKVGEAQSADRASGEQMTAPLQQRPRSCGARGRLAAAARLAVAAGRPRLAPAGDRARDREGHHRVRDLSREDAPKTVAQIVEPW